MPPQKLHIIHWIEITANRRSGQPRIVFHREALTSENCGQKIRELFSQLKIHITPGSRTFSIPVRQLPNKHFEPIIDLGQINITRIFAILRIFGWSGNLGYGKIEGETTPRWHWLSWIAAHPKHLPR